MMASRLFSPSATASLTRVRCYAAVMASVLLAGFVATTLLLLWGRFLLDIGLVGKENLRWWLAGMLLLFPLWLLGLGWLLRGLTRRLTGARLSNEQLMLTVLAVVAGQAAVGLVVGAHQDWRNPLPFLPFVMIQASVATLLAGSLAHRLLSASASSSAGSASEALSEPGEPPAAEAPSHGTVESSSQETPS